MRGRPFTPEEDEIIRRDYRTMAHKALARSLGRAVSSVQGRAYTLKLGRTRAENGKCVWRPKKVKPKSERRTPYFPFRQARAQPIETSPQALALKPAKLVSLYNLHNDECRFPYGSVKDEEGVGFCGAKCAPGKVYCSGHQVIVWTRISLVKREAA